MNSNRWSTERRSGPPTGRKGAVRHFDDNFVLEEEDQLPGAYAISSNRTPRTSFTMAPRSSLYSSSPDGGSEVRPHIQESPTFEDEPMEDVGRAWETAHVWQSVAFRSVREINQATRSRDITAFDLQTTLAKQRKRYCKCSKGLILTIIGVFCCGMAAVLAGILLSRKGETFPEAPSASGRLLDLSCGSSGPFPNYSSDCECLKGIVEGHASTRQNYESFKNSDLFRGHLTKDSANNSCEPTNMALMWAALKASDIKSNGTALTHFVLALVYETMDGQEWTNSAGWLTHSSACSWYGIECATAGDENSIKSLLLPSNGVAGALDSRLALLPELRTLDFSNNMVSGTIPSEIWNIQGLEDLLVGNNELVGSLPSPFSDYESTPSLRQLAFGSNNFFGSIPDLSGLVSLTLLDLSDTLIDSTFPTEGLADLGKLETLRLARADNIRGTLPSTIGLLTSLRSLNMTDTQLSGNIPTSMSDLVALESFEVFSSQITGTIPSTLGSLVNLSNFHVTASSLSGPIPPSFGNLTKLRYLNLRGNSLEGYVPRELASCTSLHHLDFSNNLKIQGSIPEEMGNLSSLRVIKLANTYITGSLPGGFCDQLLDVYHFGVELNATCCEHQRCHTIQDESA